MTNKIIEEAEKRVEYQIYPEDDASDCYEIIKNLISLAKEEGRLSHALLQSRNMGEIELIQENEKLKKENYELNAKYQESQEALDIIEGTDKDDMAMCLAAQKVEIEELETKLSKYEKVVSAAKELIYFDHDNEKSFQHEKVVQQFDSALKKLEELC